MSLEAKGSVHHERNRLIPINHKSFTLSHPGNGKRSDPTSIIDDTDGLEDRRRYGLEQLLLQHARYIHHSIACLLTGASTEDLRRV